MFFVSDAFSQGTKTYIVPVNTPYTFPGNGSSCERAEWRKESSPTDATIATNQNKICLIEKGFQEEFSCKENHLLLNSAKYTDKGTYEFVCNEEEKTLILDVLCKYSLYLIPIKELLESISISTWSVTDFDLKYSLTDPVNVDTAEMDNITLNCYAANARDVTWLHNDTKVLHYKKGGTITPGKAYEGRVSLEKNCFKTGDLSLTITGVCMKDAGLYRCFVDDETAKGYPHTYLLHVKGKTEKVDLNLFFHLHNMVKFLIFSFFFLFILTTLA